MDMMSFSETLVAAASAYREAKHPAALTGAGISVESGIPDFRSRQGIWSRFDPAEYATLEAFLVDPKKSWKMFRALGRELQGTKPNPAHLALARLEQQAGLKGIVTQNVDGLHQKAGSEELFEVHGEHRHLQCLNCLKLEGARDEHLEDGPVPRCSACGTAQKPNVVLFGEMLHQLDEAIAFLADCDFLLVIGTSVEVYPVSGLPDRVQHRGGKILEFNLESTAMSDRADFILQGPASKVVPKFASTVLGLQRDWK